MHINCWTSSIVAWGPGWFVSFVTPLPPALIDLWKQNTQLIILHFIRTVTILLELNPAGISTLSQHLTTSSLNVEMTLNFGFESCCNVERPTLFQRWNLNIISTLFHVEISALFQRWSDISYIFNKYIQIC